MNDNVVVAFICCIC